MTHALTSLLVLTLSTLVSTTAQAQELTGDWLGTLETPGGNLRLLVTITEDETGELTAVMESLDQAPGRKIPVSTVEIDPDHLHFEIAGMGASFTGEWVVETESYDGEFNQGLTLPMSMRRPDAVEAHIVEGMDGVWETVLDREGTLLGFALKIETTEAGTQVALDSVDQGAYGIPVTNFDRDGDRVGFQIPAANVTFSGEVDGDRMTGQWLRPGFPDVTLEWTRTSYQVIALNRPQMPHAPFPYRTEEVRFDNPADDSVSLAGTLTRPEGEGPFPAVVLISGSGPQDRDEYVWEHRPFAVLADHLTRQGIAVLRFDDRGVGESRGDFAAADMEDLRSDARAAFDFLRQQDRIDSHRVGLIGHSEGGLHAPVMAAGDDRIAFIVLLAGPGTPGSQLLKDQTLAMAEAGGYGVDQLGALADLLDAIYGALASAASPDAAREALDPILTDEAMDLMGNPVDLRDLVISQFVRQWHLDLVRHDPAPYLAALHQPVLALNGTLDLQVLASANLPAIEAALADNPDATVIALENQNHLFQRAQTGTIAEYAQIEETMSPMALNTVSDWINARFGQADR